MKRSATCGVVAVLGVVLMAGRASGAEAQTAPAVVVAEPQKSAPAPVAFASQPEAGAATVDLPVLSAYVSRGQVLNDEMVLQPAMTVTQGGLSLGVWSCLNLTDRVTEEAGDISEVDLTGSYSHRVGPVKVTGGWVEYLYPNQTLVLTNSAEAGALGTGYPATRELFLTVSAPDGVVVPSLSLYRDIDEVEGTYATAGLSWTHALSAAGGLTLGGSIGYADADYNAIYFGVDKAGWNDGNVSAALAWKVLANLTITSSIQYTTLLDSDLKDGAAGLYKDDERVWGGVKASWSL